jgi:hypothetical protein
MPSPVYFAGTPGNLINGLTVAHGTTVAAFLDLSTSIEGQVSCEMTTGGSALSGGTTFSAYKVYGNATPITLSSAASSGATSLSVSSATGIHVGQKVLLQQSSGGKLGEIATVSAVNSTTLTVSATANGYSVGDGVYLIEQTATYSTVPSSSSGSWLPSTDYSLPLFLGTGQWCITAGNGDTTNSVTVTVSVDKITAYQ